MSGHSKWHNIQKTKGAADAKRSAAFTKIAKELIVAVKQGGSGDPNNNSRLAPVVAKAKAANMPNDNIKRAPSTRRWAPAIPTTTSPSPTRATAPAVRPSSSRP